MAVLFYYSRSATYFGVFFRTIAADTPANAFVSDAMRKSDSPVTEL